MKKVIHMLAAILLIVACTKEEGGDVNPDTGNQTFFEAN